MLPKKIDHAELTDQILLFVGEHASVPVEMLDAGAPLTSLGIDSFALLEIVVLLERRFGITIPLAQLTPQNLTTASDIVRTALECAEQAAKTNVA